MIDEHAGEEFVTQADLGLDWDMGAPMPYLLQGEGTAFLAFYLRQTDAAWDGSYTTLMDPTSSTSGQVGVISWHGCAGALLTEPNDEGVAGHRLWNKGLRDIQSYSAGEVHNSRWITHLEQIARVHPLYNPNFPNKLRHYILLFHDSTLECVAEGYSTRTMAISLSDVVVQLAQELVRTG